ncbi:2Fe-2S iron-sulfur cluster-binding protein [Chitinophaga sp. S165]|uniref:2Fe-2S iron-sulfur cluster-binding protein n=1 Tax=Chitinophaga sp. S165 TaxID=2135462 RepID=UPI000D70FEFF|nr:2Fe-2S iron-sulfur cluster-binding protein [Chitinophaga sp. S165]PWV55638.1 2Fe-2S ferredoxin [Chitinophaga sp. S165]
MRTAAQPINIKVLLGDEEHDLVTYKGEYRSLMMLLFDRLYIEDFGECRGVGRCGTCLIEIIDGGPSLEAYDRNEEMTMMRLGHDTERCRLSCQIPIDDDLNGIKIRVKR